MRLPARAREYLFVAVAASAVTVVMTWPIVARFATAGRVDSGDGRYSAWNVAWVAHALITAPTDLFDANIFYPERNTLAFSEANVVAGTLAIPVWLLTGNALAASNWAILCAFFLAAVAAYALVRYLTGSLFAAAVSAVVFAFCPYMFAHVPHIQLLMTFGLPWVLLSFHRLVDQPGARCGAALGLALAVTALSCGYYGVFAAMAVGLGLAWFGPTARLRSQPRFWLGIGTAALVSLGLVAPFFVPYLGVRASGFARSLDDARLFSANGAAYLASPARLHEWMLPILGSWREVLFPGFAAAGLSVAAAIGVFRSPPPSPSPSTPRRVVGFYVALAGLAAWASFGPDAGLYAWLYQATPVFSWLRAPARFGILVTLSAAVLAGLVLSTVASSTGLRRRLLLALSALAVLETASVGPLPLVDRPPRPDAYRVLAGLPSAPVVEFPYFSDRNDRHRHTEYMLASTSHWKPLLNGYSDHIPAGAFRDMGVLSHFPDEASWEVLKTRQARYVVMHWNLYPPGAAPRELIRAQVVRRYLRPIAERDDVSLYEIGRWPHRVPAERPESAAR